MLPLFSIKLIISIALKYPVPLTILSILATAKPERSVLKLSLRHFPFSLLLPLYHGNTLSLTVLFVCLVDFQTAHQMTSQLSVLAGQPDPKKPKLY